MGLICFEQHLKKRPENLENKFAMFFLDCDHERSYVASFIPERQITLTSKVCIGDRQETLKVIFSFIYSFA